MLDPCQRGHGVGHSGSKGSFQFSQRQSMMSTATFLLKDTTFIISVTMILTALMGLLAIAEKKLLNLFAQSNTDSREH